MMPEEWPIAASAADQNAPARAAGRGRLATVRADFFLDPAKRLTEQERALMTAMLHCLVEEVADSLRTQLPSHWAAANDDGNAALVEALSRAGLLDDPELIALLLRRADEERIASAARVRSGRRESRSLQALVSHDNGAVAAAAMALIIGRGRRRDRLGQCLVMLEDLRPATGHRLIHAVAAALRGELAGSQTAAATDAELAAAASRLAESVDHDRGIDRLGAALVRLLDEAGALDEDLMLAAAHEGEAGFLAEALARRAGIAVPTAFEELLSGEARRLNGLLRIAGLSREASAGLLATIGDLLGIRDPAEAIGLFDRMTEEEVDGARAWLSTSASYRSALDALGNHG